jgi:hypothetical protein
MPDTASAPSLIGSAGPHWVRYGIAADQKYLLGDFLETYDQLVINGNMLAYMKSSLSQFVTQQVQKPFVIDPQTHAFAHDLGHLRSSSKGSAGQIKRSWGKLIDAYGTLVSEAIQNQERPLDPSDFDDEPARHKFVENVLLFQRDTVAIELEEGEDRDYLEFLKEETGVDPFVQPPALLIAPYFFVDGPLAGEWVTRNIQLIQDSRAFLESQKVEQSPLAAELVVSKEILCDPGELESIMGKYKEAAPDVLLLWIDQFSEHNATPNELQHYIKLLKYFHDAEIPVVNLFGGFFSIAMMRFSKQIPGALAAVCHGLEYGEVRPVIPLGGGTPVARFYSRKLHHRLPPRVALREIQELDGLESAKAFHDNICSCPNCEAVITSDPAEELDAFYFDTKESAYWVSGRRVTREFPTGTASGNCTRHYMWCKAWEYREFKSSLEDLKVQLTEADNRLRKVLGADYASHPKLWADSLR